MKRLMVTICLLLFIIGAWVLVSIHRRCEFTESTRIFPALEQASDLIRQGWLPDFLPPSAYNIQEKRHFEQNQIIVAFSFNPSDDLALMVQGGKELPPVVLRAIRPPVICKREAWFPDAIHEGKFNELTPQGFTIYEIGGATNGIGNGKLTHWFLALNRQAGICYLWN